MKFQWVDLHITHNTPVAKVAELANVHPATVYRWLTSYENGGIEALTDESRAPKKQAGEYRDEIKDLIRAIRKDGFKNEKRYLGEDVIAHRLEKYHGVKVSHSGVGKFLHNDGLIPEKQRRRRPKKERVKKCRIHAPGELMQMDVKYAVKSFANYWFYQYDAIDYVSGVALGEIYPLQSNYEAVTFLNRVVQRSPFAVSGIQTDNHSAFTNYYTGYKKSADPSHPRIHAFD
ncbi:MAG: transposase, partial [Candidatus Sungbacteria bacterium]|nr:transposase [Candidatus Sungbacteria bacterium]